MGSKGVNVSEVVAQQLESIRKALAHLYEKEPELVQQWVWDNLLPSSQRSRVEPPKTLSERSAAKRI